jgi:hypothetical protein
LNFYLFVAKKKAVEKSWEKCQMAIFNVYNVKFNCRSFINEITSWIFLENLNGFDIFFLLYFHDFFLLRTTCWLGYFFKWFLSDK